jgi:hypothetical protein
LKTTLIHYYALFKKKQLSSECIGIEKYSRKNLTATLAALLDQMREEKG